MMILDANCVDAVCASMCMSKGGESEQYSQLQSICGCTSNKRTIRMGNAWRKFISIFFFCAAGMVDIAIGRGQTRSINFPPTRARPNGYPSVGREHLPSLYVAAVVSSISSFLQRIRTAARTSHNRRWGTKRQYAIRRSERNWQWVEHKTQDGLHFRRGYAMYDVHSWMNGMHRILDCASPTYSITIHYGVS